MMRRNGSGARCVRRCFHGQLCGFGFFFGLTVVRLHKHIDITHVGVDGAPQFAETIDIMGDNPVFHEARRHGNTHLSVIHFPYDHRFQPALKSGFANFIP